jgi:hypothetical protein
LAQQACAAEGYKLYLLLSCTFFLKSNKKDFFSVEKEEGDGARQVISQQN